KSGIQDVEAFVRKVALGFMPSFLPIAERRGREPFSVKFGLSGGRVESIMVSAPPLVSWTYNHVPEDGSEEDRLVKILRKPRDWV
ncbi:unnamed protein product, partial [Ectocarpus sp. 4 AP-2014]